MARPKPSGTKVKTVAENRRARFDYAIDQTFEAGIALTGTEVKALRFGAGSIAESYAEVKDEQVWLINSNIPEYSHGNRENHGEEEHRPPTVEETLRSESEQSGQVSVLKDQLGDTERCSGRQEADDGADQRNQRGLQ